MSDGRFSKVVAHIVIRKIYTLHAGYKFQQTTFEIFLSYFLGFVISCKLPPLETICMKCQILFSRKNKNIISLLSVEFAHSIETPS